MYATKTPAYPSKAPFRYSSLEKAPRLTHGHKAKLERPANDKHSSFLQTLIKSLTIFGKKLLNIRNLVTIILNLDKKFYRIGFRWLQKT